MQDGRDSELLILADLFANSADRQIIMTNDGSIGKKEMSNRAIAIALGAAIVIIAMDEGSRAAKAINNVHEAKASN